jgi:hypothetical protein
MVSGWPKTCKLPRGGGGARAFQWEYSYKRLQLAQLLDQLGILVTFPPPCTPSATRQNGSLTFR